MVLNYTLIIKITDRAMKIITRSELLNLIILNFSRPHILLRLL